MDHSDYSRNRHNEHLGVNKIGKNIKKSPLYQPNFANPPRQQQQQPQPQVYNINKNDFRNIVQQLTGSPSHHSQEPLPRPPPKSPSMRLQRIRPPPLSPINVNRPRIIIHPAAPQVQMPPQYGPGPRPRPAQYGQPPPRTMVPPPPPFGSGGNHNGWANTAESPISSYMRYLQNSMNDSPQGHPQVRNHMQVQQQQSSGLLPYPPVAPLPSPRTNGPPPFLSPRTNRNGNGNGLPPLLPSPTSQFLLPSPSGYLNLSSPRSPYPLLSPGYQYPPPLSPNIPFSPMAQPGILGPRPQPPPSPRSFPVSRTKLEGFDG